MATEKYGSSGKFDPTLMELPQVGWQTVTFWSARFGLSRESFVKKLKMIGVRSNSFELVNAETLFRAIERHEDDRQSGR